MTKGRVVALNRYELKGGRGKSLTSARLTDRGFELDRGFMVTDANLDMISQRENPKVCLINLEIISAVPPYRISLSAEKVPPLEFSFNLVDFGYCLVHTDLCGSFEIKEAQNWLTSFLGAEARLVIFAASWVRAVLGPRTPVTAIIRFADGHQYSLASTRSLDHLNSLVSCQIPMNRFRPNIVVEGFEPYDEDTWLRIKIGKIIFEVVSPTARCSVTTINQDTGKVDPSQEPMLTLAKYRRRGNNVYFGMNLDSYMRNGQINVDDEVEVLERGQRLF